MTNNESISEVAKELNLELSSGSFNERFEQLASAINQLLTSRFDKLVSILYRLDVSENKLRALLAQQPSEDAGKLIAGLMIERQAEKIASREEFKGPSSDIDENEKW